MPARGGVAYGDSLLAAASRCAQGRAIETSRIHRAEDPESIEFQLDVLSAGVLVSLPGPSGGTGWRHTLEEMQSATLRRLLDRRGSYPAIRAAGASGKLHALLPVTLFHHIGTVYHRLEQCADGHHGADLAALRLTVLLHEEPLPWLPRVVAAAGFSDFAPTVLDVTAGFGDVWKATTDEAIARYAEVHRPHLAPLLLFELAHEGRPTSEMERAAELGGLSLDFARWVAGLHAAQGDP